MATSKAECAFVSLPVLCATVRRGSSLSTKRLLNQYAGVSARRELSSRSDSSVVIRKFSNSFFSGCGVRSLFFASSQNLKVFLVNSRNISRQNSSSFPATSAEAASTVSPEKSEQTIEDLRKAILHPHPTNNVPVNIAEKIGLNLHHRENHPLGIIKRKIEGFFEQSAPGTFTFVDSLPPVVTTRQNFDDLLVPSDHVSRSPNDTYYVNDQTLLRCHTSAHQTELIRQGLRAFLCTGDVYRRDSIDATHYPIFHQMEGVRIFEPKDWESKGMTALELAESDLKSTLEGVVRTIFGEVEMRWVDAYFPFTDPSFELEIFFQGQWMEVLGCGVIQQAILDSCGHSSSKGWAFGLGLERLAMVLFDIPDIRLFWSEDARFVKQFEAGNITKFKPYSKFPPCFKDVSFWVSPEFTENNLCEVVRSIAGDLAEKVELIDEFTNKKTGKTSMCYRIAYRSMDRSLTDDEINALQTAVRDRISSDLKVELR